MSRRYCGIALLTLGSFLAGPVIAKTIYKIDQTVPLAGKSPAWDYLTYDAAKSRIFLGRRTAGVTIFDAVAKKEIGKIDQSEGANSATLVPEFDRGYTTNEDGTTTIFQLSTLKTIARVKIGESADNAFYEPVTKQLMFTMGDEKLLTFVDAKTHTVTGELEMTGEELEGAAADGKGSFFIAERDLNKIGKIDAANHKLVTEWPTTGCEHPTGMAIDTVHNRLFLGCKGEQPVLTVMDTTDGKVVAQMPIGRGNDGVVYDGDTATVFATGGIDGNLVIYKQTSPDSYELTEAVTTLPIARTLTIDPKTKTIYTMTAQGMVDPGKTRNLKAGAFYPNTFFDDSASLLIIAPHEMAESKAAKR